MIGRPNVQPRTSRCVVVLAGPPVQSHLQPFTHVVVWPVGSCWKLAMLRFVGSLASMT
jgi:hypothetical protein